MYEIGAFEAKNKFGHLLDRVSHGEEIVITRHGKAVARLVPNDTGIDHGRARRAVAGILKASKGVKLRGLSLKELINEGRP